MVPGHYVSTYICSPVTRLHLMSNVDSVGLLGIPCTRALTVQNSVIFANSGDLALACRESQDDTKRE